METKIEIDVTPAEATIVQQTIMEASNASNAAKSALNISNQASINLRRTARLLALPKGQEVPEDFTIEAVEGKVIITFEKDKKLQNGE